MIKKPEGSQKTIIKDSTLREGEDVAGVNFSLKQKLKIAALLDAVRIPEIEVVAPGKVFKDLEFVKKLRGKRLQVKTSGLIYVFSSRFCEEVEEASQYLNRLDLLMPVSPKREPFGQKTKIDLLLKGLAFSKQHLAEVGVGFPHSLLTKIDFLFEIGAESLKGGAKRITIYDTTGISDPFATYDLIKRLKKVLKVPLFFHGHNDLGLATANSLAAVYAGADGLDVTVNGLGDRAGNASLEQVALSLHLKEFETGVRLRDLKRLSETVEKESGVNVSRLAPVVGGHIFVHKSPGHLKNPELFEAFDPQLVGFKRKLNCK